MTLTIPVVNLVAVPGGRFPEAETRKQQNQSQSVLAMSELLTLGGQKGELSWLNWWQEAQEGPQRNVDFLSGDVPEVSLPRDSQIDWGRGFAHSLG